MKPPIFPKVIQDELNIMPTREDANENLRIIELVFSRSRVDTTDAAVKLLFLHCAKQEQRIYALIEEIASLKEHLYKKSEVK